MTAAESSSIFSEGALNEFGKVVELEMTCSYVAKENPVGLTIPVAMNAGIKEGVSVPEGGIGKHSIALFEPANFLANLRYVARVVSTTSVLELNALKSQLSAYYSAKGGYQLPRHTEPKYIVGLEDKTRNNGECDGGVDVPIQGPFEEEWLSLPVSVAGQTPLRKCSLISEDKLYQRRKQKSIAELMGGEMDVKSKNNEEDMAKEGTHSGKLTSKSGRRKKKKGNDEAESHAGNNLTSLSGRKRKIRISETPITTEIEDASVQGNEEIKKSQVSKERRWKKSSHIENDGGSGSKEETENISGSRERKKSKYLSPPYTNIKWGETKLSSKDFFEVASDAHVRERMTKAAGQLIGSQILKSSDKSRGLSPETAKQDEYKMIDPMATKASPNNVLSQIRSAALNPPYARETNSLDMITGFLSVFRSSVYQNGSNYETYNQHRPGRKRKFLDSEPTSSGKDINRTTDNSNSVEHKTRQLRSKKNEAKDNNSIERKSKRTRSEKNEAKLDERKLKQAAAAGASNDKKTKGKASSATLFLTYGPGASMPSKDDLIAAYGKFGTLNEVETEVLYNSFCAKVVFVKSSDAERAFKDSMRMSLSSSGSSEVSYRLRYLSDDKSRIREVNKNRHPKASSPSPAKEEGGRKSTAENSPLQFIRQKLETMTTMLEKSDENMSQGMKMNLESEMKGLLEKVRTMAGSSSP